MALRRLTCWWIADFRGSTVLRATVGSMGAAISPAPSVVRRLPGGPLANSRHAALPLRMRLGANRARFMLRRDLWSGHCCRVRNRRIGRGSIFRGGNVAARWSLGWIPARRGGHARNVRGRGSIRSARIGPGDLSGRVRNRRPAHRVVCGCLGRRGHGYRTRVRHGCGTNNTRCG
jgi:hypothetical protein